MVPVIFRQTGHAESEAYEHRDDPEDDEYEKNNPGNPNGIAAIFRWKIDSQKRNPEEHERQKHKNDAIEDAQDK